MEYRKRRLPWVLMILGMLMALWAMVMLLQVPNVLQYVIQPPEPGENNEAINALLDKAQETWEAHHSSFEWMALSGGSSQASILTASDTIDVNLVAIDGSWLEIYPRFLKEGRRISPIELEHGTAVAVLDEGLALELYGSELPESATVTLNNVLFRVVGTVRHGGSLLGGRGVADAVPYDVYVPLNATISNGITLETLTLSALPRSGLGWDTTFLSAATQWTANGQLINLNKEVMRRTMLPRLLLLIVGAYALIGLFLRITDLVMSWFQGYRQALSRHYFKELIPRLLGIVALTLACYGALVGAAWLLLSFSVQPVYVFTEWVPENFVEWSSIIKVFWGLVSTSAGLVRLATRELRIVEFWGALLRWGVILVLLGAALLPKAPRGRKRGTTGYSGKT